MSFAEKVGRRLRDLGLLEPGDDVQHVIKGRKGISPYAFVARWVPRLTSRRIIVVTRRSILVLRARRPRSISPGAVSTCDRDTRLGPLVTRWSHARLGHEAIWIPKRFRPEVDAADASRNPYVSEPGKQPVHDIRGGGSANVFLVLAGPALLVGGHDVLSGTITEAQWTGVAFAAAGALMAAAGVGLLVDEWRQSWAPHIALLAGLVGIALGLYLFVNQLSYVDGARRLLPALWAGWVVACVIAIVRRPRSESSGTQSKTVGADGFWVATLARLSSLGIGATLVVSLLQFGLAQVQSAPNSAAWGLDISPQLGDDGQSLDRVMHDFSVHVTLKNPTGSEVQILRSTYALFGTGLSPLAGIDEDFGQRLKQSPPAGRFQGRYTSYGPRELLEVGEFLTISFPLQPGQEYVAEFELAVPEDALSKYRILRLETNFSVARGSRLRVTAFAQSDIGACSYRGRAADQCTVTQWQIVPPGWLWSITHGGQTVETVQGLRFKAVNVGQQSSAGAIHSDASWLYQCITRDVGQMPAPPGYSVCDPSRIEPDLEAFFGLGYLSPVVYEQPILAPRQP